MNMTPKEIQPDEAIRRLLQFSKPDSPSADFTARIMEQVLAPAPAKSWLARNQWLLFIVTSAVFLLLFYFPIWSLFGYEFTPGQFFMYYAGKYVTSAALWLGEVLSRFAGMGKMWYLFPVSVAILLLAVFDQAISKKAHLKTA
jgi:hypothetical protein